MIGLRYFLLPYIYSEYMKACLKDEMLFRPLSFDYEADPHASQVEDQLMLGDSVMIAPVLQQNATGRYVYLPEEMKLLRLRSKDDFDEQILPQGHHYVHCALDEVLLFIRPDRMILVSEGGECEPDVDFEHVKPIAFVKTEAGYDYYHDDGISREVSLEGHLRHFTVTK
jgi:alpha-glucosidase